MSKAHCEDTDCFKSGECISPHQCWHNGCQKEKAVDEQDLVYRLRKRAEIRRRIPGRKSVQEGKEDRLADLLDEAATEIEQLRNRAGDNSILIKEKS